MSWILVTSWKTFLAACNCGVTRQGILRYPQHMISSFCWRSFTLSPLTFKILLGVCNSKRLFCFSKDRLCKLLQSYNICFDTIIKQTGCFFLFQIPLTLPEWKPGQVLCWDLGCLSRLRFTGDCWCTMFCCHNYVSQEREMKSYFYWPN